MSCSEGSSSSRYIFFDGHAWITESDKTDSIALLSKNSKLLGLTGCPLRFIITTKSLTTISYTHFFFFLVFGLAFPITFLGGLPTFDPYVPFPIGIMYVPFYTAYRAVSPNCVGLAPSRPITAFCF
jgi:hypothetical protein